MNEKSPNDVQKSDCCGQGECCSSSTANKRQWWRIAVFALGMLLVVVGITYSIITRHPELLGNMFPRGSTERTSPGANSSACANMGFGDAAWARNLAPASAKYEYLFLILSGSTGDSAKEATRQVERAVAKMQADGLSVSSFALSPSDLMYPKAVKRLAVSELPAVFVLGKGGNGAVVTSNFEERRLLEAYRALSQAPTCIPGGSSGCCPQ